LDGVSQENDYGFRILSSSEFRDFWISWDDNTIRMGKGATVGSKQDMSYTNPNPFIPRYVAFSSKDDGQQCEVTISKGEVFTT
jgi:hypothetical protein